MKLLEKATSPTFWETVRTSPDYQELRDIVQNYYETSRYDEIPVLKFKPRMRFYADGDRSEFESPYFRRRTYISSAALLALIYPDEAGYIEEVEEIMMAICEEMSWCLPAHAARDLTDTVNKIDLFNAETGFTLAEICYLLEDRLDPFVLDRAKTEVKARIADRYENYVYFWESNTANWAAVCAGNVGGALMYLFPEEFKELLPRFLSTMQCLLDGFPDRLVPSMPVPSNRFFCGNRVFQIHACRRLHSNAFWLYSLKPEYPKIGSAHNNHESVP